MQYLKVEPLTAQAFKPYGDVIQTASAKQQFDINEGNTVRFHDISDIEFGEGAVCTSIFESSPVAYPFPLKVMERHPLGSQMFIPLSKNPYYVVVAAPGEFDETTLRAFLARPNQGINFFKNTWHHYSLSLVSVSQFLVIDRKGEGNNLEEVFLSGDSLLPAYSE